MQNVIFIPGLSYNQHLFEHVVQQLGDDYNVQTFIPEKDGMDENLADLNELVEHSTYIVGHSLGGTIALAFAGTYPDKVAKVVTSGSGAHYFEGIEQFITAALDEVATGGMDNFKNNLRHSAMGEHCKNTEEMSEIIIKMQAEVPEATIVAQMKTLKSGVDITALLGNITASCLIIHNELDGFYNLEEEEYIVKSIKNAKLAVVSGVGHMGLLEEKDKYATLIIDFFKAN